MTCQEFLARYSEYLDERLDPIEAARWRGHLGRCSACARYDRVVRGGLELIQELPTVEPSPDFQPRLQHRLYHVDDDLAAGERATGASAVVSLAIAGMLAAVAWSPLLRPDPLMVELPAVEARAPRGALAAVPSAEPFALPATWGAGLLLAGRESGPRGPRTSRWWWDPLSASGTAAPPSFRFLTATQLYSPGPHTPLVVDRPAFGAADAAGRIAGAGHSAVGRE